MSSERDIQERRRIRERRRKAQEEKFPPVQAISSEDRINRFAIPTRASILDTVDVRTRDDKDLNKLVTKSRAHRTVLIEFIDARIAIANGNRDLLDNFIKKTDPKSENYNPRLSGQIDRLNIPFHIVLSRFPKPRQ